MTSKGELPSMAILRIYTDGGCAGNQSDQNFGGWGAILEFGEHKKELYGGEANTTNNRMELTAVIEAFKALKKTGPVTDPATVQCVIKKLF
jgi:ribonuclease HI